jgi:dTDP-4-dehydrorhamnose reductase
MNILITGANGQLGQEFRSILKDSDHDVTFLGREDLDITNQSSFKENSILSRADVMINCAAYTNVDKAEEDITKAFQVNENGAEVLAQFSKINGIKLIHISTDYVYHIESSNPLQEKDNCLPLGVYAKSKLAGERAIINSGCEYIIMRVSWLYSSYKNNFVKTMLRLGASRESLSVVSDQIGSPTYARDLALTILQIIETEKFKNHPIKEIYNYSNLGQTSWDAFARKIFDLCHIECKVNSITTEEFGAKAPRPKWSVLSKEKIQRDFNISLPQWQESLHQCLEELDGIA